jgi:hypothetical protein
MGLSELFKKQDVRKEHLLISGDGSIPIEKINSSSASKKIDYAWKVYNSNKDKYTPDHKSGALEYLRRQFKIPNEEPLERKIAYINTLVKRKTDSHIPDFSALKASPSPQLPLTPLPEVIRPEAEAEAERPPKTPMKKIKSVTWPTPSPESSSTFLQSINQDIEQLNLLIEDYNNTRGKTQQIKTLQEIYKKHQAIENKYSGKHVTACPDYREELHSKLFNEMQHQFSSAGIVSMKDVLKIDPASLKPHSNESESLGAFSEILSNMSPEKVSSLLSLLIQGPLFWSGELSFLYKTSEPGFKEFQKFLNTNTIEFLGGTNSQNFKITPNDGSPHYVLKVDNRMGMPKSAEAHLRTHSLQETFTPVAAERQSCAVNIDGQTVTRAILVTEFCSGGDIQSHGKKHKADSEAQKIAAAVTIYGQMGRILEGIRKDGCSFPDMKNSNWLIDEHNVVRLADTKSFLFTDAKGNIDYFKNQKDWYGFLSTSHMNPPEFTSFWIPFSADKMHSFMLGKNLYQYLSNCNDMYLKEKNDAFVLDFSNTIFHGAQGQMFKALIDDLVKSEPSARISVDAALKRLEKITTLPLRNDCQNILNQLKQANLPEYLQLERTISTLNTATELTAFKNTLINKKEGLIVTLKAQCNTVLDEIKKAGRARDADFIAQQEKNINIDGSLEKLVAAKEPLLEKRNKIYVDTIEECRNIICELKRANFPESELRDMYWRYNLTELTEFKSSLINKKEGLIVTLKEQYNTVLDDIKKVITDDIFIAQQKNNVNTAASLDQLVSVGKYLLPQKEQILAHTKHECRVILENVRLSGFGAKDTVMSDYIKEQTAKIESASNLEECTKIKNELNTMLQIVNQPAVVEIKSTIQSFRDKALPIFTTRMKDKANRIETAMCMVPLAERANILEGNSDTIMKVKEALASHRHWWRQPVYYKTTDGKLALDEAKAAKSYDNFKTRLNEIKAKDPERSSVANKSELNDEMDAPSKGF